MDMAILWTAFTAHHPLHFGSLGVKDQSILSAQYCAKKKENTFCLLSFKTPNVGYVLLV